MRIDEFITLLKESLEDIPANPDNIHYTGYQALKGILETGLDGAPGGYRRRSPKTRVTIVKVENPTKQGLSYYLEKQGSNYDYTEDEEVDPDKTYYEIDGNKSEMELATVRNSHKLTPEEAHALSIGTDGGVKINLFTKRILAGHRDTRKDNTSELVQDNIAYEKKYRNKLKNKFGVEPPIFYEELFKHLNKFHFNNTADQRRKGDAFTKDWLIKNGYKNLANNPEIVDLIYEINSDIYYRKYYQTNREREERFILKRAIPADPRFMNIVLEHMPIGDDIKFCEDKKNAREFLQLIEKHIGVFTPNRTFRNFRNYLRSIIDEHSTKYIR